MTALRAVPSCRPVSDVDPSNVHPYGVLLRALRFEANLSQAALSRLASIDPAYVNRLERAAPTSTNIPSRKVTLLLAEALNASDADTERLLMAAGHAPESIMRAGRWEPVIGEIVDVLADSRLSVTDLEEFRDLLRIVTAKWRPVARLVGAEG